MRQLEETLLLLADQDPPVDPGHLIDRIERDLIGEGVPIVALDGRRTMQTRERPQVTTQPRRARKAWAFAAALVAAAAVVGIPVWLLSSDVTNEVASPPMDVFDLATDRFCDWVTADDMTEAVAAAQRRAGTDIVFEDFTECRGFNINRGSSVARGGMWTTPGWYSSRGLMSSIAVAVDPLPPEEVGVNPDDFAGHRLLDDAVTHEIRTNQFAWQEGVDLHLLVEGHEDEILYFGLGVDNHDGRTELSGEYTEFGLALANELLARMNWVPTTFDIDEASAQLGPPGDLAGPTGPDRAFSWGDDLSEWVTEEEMAQALADVVRQYRGANLEDGVTISLSRPDGEGDDGWSWEAVGWSVQVHSGDHDGRFDVEADVEATLTDPRLPEGVTYQEGWGFAWMSRILVGPNSDESICVTLVPADRAFEDPDYEDMVFAIGSMMLREMRWAD